MTIALSGHGASVQRAPAATPTVFTTIAEMGDINWPSFKRNVFDATTQNRNVDASILGVLRRNPCTLSLNFLPTDSTHDNLTGVISAIVTEPPPIDGYKFTFPTSAGTSVWVMSGQVSGVQNIKAPVDGKIAAEVTIQFTGGFTINGAVYI